MEKKPKRVKPKNGMIVIKPQKKEECIKVTKTAKVKVAVKQGAKKVVHAAKAGTDTTVKAVKKAANSVSKTTVKTAKAVKKSIHEIRIKPFKIYSKDCFKAGVNSVKNLSDRELKRRDAFMLASAATSYYIARCDGSISNEEMNEIIFDLDAYYKNKDLPKEITNELYKIKMDKKLTFTKVKKYLDDISIASVKVLMTDIDEIIMADNVKTIEEISIKKQYKNYIKERQKGNNNE